MNQASKPTYREPGTGAIEFAAEYTEGKTREQAKSIIRRLLAGYLHDMTDKRVKRCSYCGYFYRDKTRNNSSKTCSRECKIDRDTLKRRQKKLDKELLEGKPSRKKTLREELYADWLEYPFWANEDAMIRYHRQMESGYSTRKVEQIAAAKQRDEMMGGKRTPRRVVPYSGREENDEE
ncbi:MAG TPA: hypothetical protein VFK33_10875 [Bacillales bacterium]|nr:hypothetical protein [Bacillales bacterium]